MKTIITITTVSLGIITTAIAVTPTSKRLTPQVITDLTSPSESPNPKNYRVAISGISLASPSDPKKFYSDPVNLNPTGIIECIREFIFPHEWEPPKVEKSSPVSVPTRGGGSEQVVPVTPTTPTGFQPINIGWTIHLTAKPIGKLVALYGIVDYTAVEMVRGGYGPIAGPIYSEKGRVLLSENKLDQPKFQTTTTRFHIFALPGEVYEVTFYRGTKAEEHLVTLTVANDGKAEPNPPANVSPGGSLKKAHHD